MNPLNGDSLCFYEYWASIEEVGTTGRYLCDIWR